MTDKKILDYSVNGGYLVQKYSSGRFNAVDSAYLTTNYIYQNYIGGKDHINGLNLAYAFIDENFMFRRFPISHDQDSESRNWSNTNNCSRDNSMGTICCLTELGDHIAMKKVAKNIFKNKSFFQNTHTVKGIKKEVPPDFCIAEWSVIYRGMLKEENRKWHYPVLLVLDLLMLINILIYIIKNWFDKTYNSPLFHMISTILCITRNSGTFVGAISKWMLFNLLPQCPGYEDDSPVISQLMEYSRMNYDPPICESTRGVLK